MDRFKIFRKIRFEMVEKGWVGQYSVAWANFGIAVCELRKRMILPIEWKHQTKSPILHSTWKLFRIPNP